ncbi:MAG: hypothetical protein MJ197_01385 [Bacteroidales bacterium]|nr:hypothetical protein [Bacteroidales bacterium]
MNVLHKHKGWRIFSLALFVCIQFATITYFVSCATNKYTKSKNTHSYIFNILYPTDSLNIPENNPTTKEGVTLGRYLFYDGRLSGRTHTDSLLSCASCHRQSRSFECGIDHPKYKEGKTFGLTGIPTPHVTMPLINLAWNHEGYMWNGFVSKENKQKPNIPYPANYQNLESFVWMMIIAPHECNGNIEQSVAIIAQDTMYHRLFREAFGTEEITIDKISKAVAQFVRTLISFDSKFDKFMRGETQLTDSEMRGFFLFTTEKADCFHCHGSPAEPLWTSNQFMNNARDIDFTDNHDRYSVTHDELDKGKYRVPTLRNIEFTAPYMHDGQYKTLDEVLNFYNTSLKRSPYVDPLMINVNHGGMFLSENELTDLKAFLLTLSDTSFLHNPAYSNPMPENPYFIK